MYSVVFAYLEDCYGEYISNVERMYRSIETKEDFETMINCLQYHQFHMKGIEQMIIEKAKEKFGE